jgi:hypothetical protein
MVKILHYDGTPITARFISRAISERLPASLRRATDRNTKEAA